MAISDRGLSAPFFRTSGHAFNGEVYGNGCIRDQLQPFIQELHGEDDIIFWSDLASAHHDRATLELLDELGIAYVPKDANPPNVPQLWPVEDLEDILKDQVYRGGWEAETDRQLKQGAQKYLREMDWAPVQERLSRLKTDIRKAADPSPTEFL